MKPINAILVFLLFGDEVVSMLVLAILGLYYAYKLLEVAPHD